MVKNRNREFPAGSLIFCIKSVIIGDSSKMSDFGTATLDLRKNRMIFP
jgi:hypothetical protein